MKKIIAIASTIALSTLALQASAQDLRNVQDRAVVSTTVTPVQEETKVAITKEELPAPILKALESEPLAETEFVSAFVHKGEIPVYEITLSKEGQEATIRFDKDGNIL